MGSGMTKNSVSLPDLSISELDSEKRFFLTGKENGSWIWSGEFFTLQFTFDLV